ncbi:MAG: hypothetical protein QOE73_2237 [Verrucomicrobiota bacterium]|jgi:hypothetical protein
MPYSHETARLSTPAASQFGIGDASFLSAGDTGCRENARQNNGKGEFRFSQRAALQTVEMARLSL